MHRVNPLLQQAYQTLQAGQIEEANRQINQAYVIAPNHPDVLHLAALCRGAAQDAAGAEKFFIRALSLSKDNVQILTNYANHLMAENRLKDSEKHYRKSIKIQPNYIDAILGLTLCLSRAEEHENAIKVVRAALKFLPQDHRLYNALGTNFKKLNRVDEALEAYDKALSIAPNDFFALHNKGVALRIKLAPDESLKCYDQILEQGKNIPELRFNRGCAFYDLGQIDKAEQELQKSIALRPDYIDAHQTLNKLYWEHGEDKKFLTSYETAIKRAPQDPHLRSSFASQLMMAGRQEQAEDIVKKAIKDIGEVPTFLHDLGAMRARHGDFEKAKELTHKAIEGDPQSTSFRIDMANYYIREHNFEQAMAHLDEAEKYKPHDQEMWAYKGICWRLSGDEREHWLNNYDDFVQAHFLETPDGYDNFEHFMDVLKNELITMHTTDRHPLDQSLRNGTQTTSFLLNVPSKVIQDYRQQLERCVTNYLNSLPSDPSHPLLSRKENGFTFSGSWSVRLKNEGYHVNHIHPEGWLSGPTYIEIPSSMSPDDPNQAGWVKFGETALGLGDDEHIAKSVCPEPGLVVFFPSYMWHGTNPFQSDEYRMTTPCDIMPLSTV